MLTCELESILICCGINFDFFVNLKLLEVLRYVFCAILGIYVTSVLY